MAITLEQAKKLSQGEWIYQSGKFGSNKRLLRYRVTSVKTWKTRPYEIEVRVKHGMYKNFVLTADHLPMFQLTDEDQPKA